MENLNIEPTEYIPRIFFDFKNHVFEIRGKSYPENTAEFYSPVFFWMERYLEQLGNDEVIINVELTYFNSSSSKILMDFFDLLDIAASQGKKITINWIYDNDDETIREYGLEFQEDLESLEFNMIPKTDNKSRHSLNKREIKK